MPCYHPLSAWRSWTRNESGKVGITFRASEGGLPVQVPCGQCIGCRLERSRQWAVRCIHEASLHSENSFVTLTYDDGHFPADGSLDVRAFQLFMKRLRKARGNGVRFFHCGEYGEEFSRPHYHALLFGVGFRDRVPWSVSNGLQVYRSPELERLWPLGFSTVGDVTFESAAYVARYVTKKVTGNAAAEHYKGRKPEYVTMSRRPGIAAEWYRRFRTDVFPSDFLVVPGRGRCKPPRFYDKQLEAESPELMREVKIRRMLLNRDKEDNSPRALIRRGDHAEVEFTRRKRSYEDGT